MNWYLLSGALAGAAAALAAVAWWAGVPLLGASVLILVTRAR